MKTNLRYYLTVACILIGFHLKAQDVIIKNDKTEIKAKVIELTDELIKYRKSTMLDGPLYSIKKEEVFMIVYKDGTKEYIEVKKATVVQPPVVYAPTPVQTYNYNSTMSSKPANTATSSERDESDKTYAIFSANDGFTALGLQAAFPLKNHLYIGLDYIQGISEGPSVASYGGFLAYKYPIDKNFAIWSNAEYLYTSIESFKVGTITIPSSSASGFTWTVGTNYVFNNGWGLTLYSYEAKGVMFGIIMN